MAEINNFSFDEWKDYLKTDKDMNRRWKSLIALWEEVSNDIKKTLEWLPKAEASSRRRELTALNIFNILNNTNQKLDFTWHKKSIWNQDDGRREYVVECYSASSDFVFKKIKEYRWVASMYWTSINKYLQPVANKIWALKVAMNASVNPETNKLRLSYESMKTDIVDDEKEVNPNYPNALEWWRDPVVPWSETTGYEEIEEENKKEDNKSEKEEKKDEEDKPIFDETGQGIINFKEFRK